MSDDKESKRQINITSLGTGVFGDHTVINEKAEYVIIGFYSSEKRTYFVESEQSYILGFYDLKRYGRPTVAQ